MNRNLLSFFLLAGVAGVTAVAPIQPRHEQSAPTDPPNIVLILTDDQGYGDLGATGNPVIETPHLDALARQSAQMRQFYVSPVCSPTRASLLTGRYNYRTGVVDTYIGRSMMRPDELTLAELLKPRGYQSGVFGKWHLGDCYPLRAIDQGFDEALVHFGGGLAQPSDLLENGRRYTDVTLFRNGQPTPTKGYCTDVYFGEALGFMEKAVRRKKPFFAYIAPNAPHDPFDDVPADLLRKYQGKDLNAVLPPPEGKMAERTDAVARVFAMIENIDQNVGRLMQKLTEWGIDDNTIVIFMTDNGPNTRRYVGTMRGMKGQVHDGGIRTSFFIRWPGQIKAGLASDVPVAHIDLTPTLLAAAGTRPPTDRTIDGHSFLPLLRSEAVAWPDRTLYLQWHRGDVPQPFVNFAARGERYKLLSADGTAFELYDVRADPTETTNLAATQPAVLERMKTDYRRWYDDVSSTRPDNYAKPRIVLGSRAETTTRLSRQEWHLTQGTGWGTQGVWKISSRQPARYTVDVILEKPLPGHALTLTGFGQTWTGVLLDDGRRGRFDGVSLPAGESDLRVGLSANGTELGPYQVILRRL
jgi:arylsulfatase/arylsulfatase A